MAQDELDPRHAALPEVRSHHVRERPALQVRALEQRVEEDLARRRARASSRGRCPRRREAGSARRRTRPRRETRPRVPPRGRPRTSSPHRRPAGGRGGAGDCGTARRCPGRRASRRTSRRPQSAPDPLRTPPGSGANASACGSTSASTKTTMSPVASSAPAFLRRRRPVAFGDDDELLRRLVRGRDRVETRGERRRVVRRGDDRGQRRHGAIT